MFHLLSSLYILVVSCLSSFIFSYILVLFRFLLSCLVLSSLLFCRVLFSLCPCLLSMSLCLCLCLSLSLSLHLRVVLWLCCCVVLCLVLWCVCGVVCVVWHRENPRVSTQYVPVCPLKTSPCARSKRPRVYRHHTHMFLYVLDGHRQFCSPKFAHIGLTRDPEVHQK